MRKLIVLVLTLMMVLSLAGCGSNLKESVEPKAETTGKEDNRNTVSNADNNVQKESNIPITLTVGETVITAALNNSKTSQDFIKTLPRTMTMRRWGNREYYGKVQSDLSTEGTQRNGFENGDVAYYPPGGSFAIFFNEANPTTPSPLIIMGKISSDLKVFDKMGETVEMKIEINK